MAGLVPAILLRWVQSCHRRAHHTGHASSDYFRRSDASSKRAASVSYFFSLQRVSHVGVDFKMDELMDLELFRETSDRARFVFVDTSNEIVRDANVKRPAGTACEMVDVILRHNRLLPKRDGRDKPGHDKPKDWSR